ncbi:MAG: type I-A CRISPR-associated protein Cas4/Csa1 [Zestosphaera sp.]
MYPSSDIPTLKLKASPLYYIIGVRVLFFTWDDVVRFSREIRRLPQPEIDEELRGWSWGDSVMASSATWLLGVSDITGNFCPNGRDVYLRYVLRIKQRDNQVLQKGRLIHEVFSKAVTLVKRIIYESNGDIDGGKLYRLMSDVGVKLRSEVVSKYDLIGREGAMWIFDKLWDEAARTYSAALDKALSRSAYMALESLVAATVPLITEFPIDGSLIGLSRALRIDAFMPPSLLVEIKSRKPDPIYELSLVGYALAFESHYEIPINYGILVYVDVDPGIKRVFVRPSVIPISSKARSEFIELRDRRKEMLIYGEVPRVAEHCPVECPYIHYCRGGLDG